MNPRVNTSPADDDDQLLDDIGRIATRIDPAPDEAYELGRDAFVFHRIDEELIDHEHIEEELAVLIADSRTESSAVRSWGEDVRLLTYRCPGLTIEVQVSREGPGFHVLGLLARDAATRNSTAQKNGPSGGLPQNGGRIHLEIAEGPASSAVIDDDDRFEFRAVPEAMVRLRIEPAGRASVTTAWLEM